ALLLSSERTICHGACLESVCSNIRSRAREYSYQRGHDSRSIGESFHCRSGSSMRADIRRSCSSCPTSSHSLISWIPFPTMSFSTEGQYLRNSSYCSFVQNPITCSTPARLYQLRSKITT